MAEFVVGPREEFDHRRALIAMLQLLRDLFAEIWEDRRGLLPEPFQEVQPPAFEIAWNQIRALMGLVERLVDRAEELDQYGLRGDALRFKLQVIEYANERGKRARNRAVEDVSDGRRPGRWRFYRRAVAGTLAAIDGPLESLTKLLGVNEAVVEFKKAIEILLGLTE